MMYYFYIPFLFQGQYGSFVQLLPASAHGIRQMSDGEKLVVVTEQKCFDFSQPYVEVKLYISKDE